MSQFFANKLYLNPGFAGNSGDVEIHSGFRSQWPGFEMAYNTYTFNYNQYINKIGGGIGLSLVNDVQSLGINNLSVSAVYAYHLKLDYQSNLHLGLNAGIVNNLFSPQNYVFPSQLDGGIPPSLTGTSDLFADIGTGFILQIRNWSLGFSGDHLFQYSIAGEKSPLPMKFTVHLMGKLDYNPHGLQKPMFVIFPVFLFQQQSANQQLNYGLYVERENITAGIWFKQNLFFDFYSTVFLIGLDIDNYRIAYSFDSYFMRHQKAGLFSTAHEVTFTINYMYKEKVKKIRAIKCPKF